MQLTALPIPFVMTRDRAQSLPFWRDVLGFDVIEEGAYAVILGHGDLRIGLVSTSDLTPSAHTVLGLPVADIEAASGELATAGVSFIEYPGLTEGPHQIWTAPGGGKRLNWFTDPDGNVLGLIEERPAYLAE